VIQLLLYALMFALLGARFGGMGICHYLGARTQRLFPRVFA